MEQLHAFFEAVRKLEALEAGEKHKVITELRENINIAREAGAGADTRRYLLLALKDHLLTVEGGRQARVAG